MSMLEFWDYTLCLCGAGIVLSLAGLVLSGLQRRSEALSDEEAIIYWEGQFVGPERAEMPNWRLQPEDLERIPEEVITKATELHVSVEDYVRVLEPELV